jgi:hypothetical protein
MRKVKKKERITEPHWQDMVDVYFNFCQARFNEKPTFDGSAPRDLKNILQALRKRATDAGLEWTLSVAKNRLWRFLDHAYSDSWLSKNFLLSNLNRQKDKIFFNATRQYLAR